MDPISIERAQCMHPKVRQEVLLILNYINKKILGKGVRLRLAQVWRSFAEQDAMYAQGRTRPGVIVTNAKGGDSNHNYGLAFDIVLMYDKDGDGHFEEVSWDMLRDGDKDGVPDWLEVTRYLESKGWKNGFFNKNGKKWDFPHFEKTFGYKTVQLKAKLMKGQVIQEVINGVTYNYPIL